MEKNKSQKELEKKNESSTIMEDIMKDYDSKSNQKK